MKSGMLFVTAVTLLGGNALFGHDVQPPTHLLANVTPLPVALDPDFQFRKTKLFFLGEHDTLGNKQKVGKTGDVSESAADARARSNSSVQDASIVFERSYRLYGAVTKLDEHERYGDYLDFYWRANRPADLTVRLEYRQEKLHAHVQAQECSYHDSRGTQKTEFKVIGDDFTDNGRIIAWRCLLIEGGHIVAEDRSFLWR